MDLQLNFSNPEIKSNHHAITNNQFDCFMGFKTAHPPDGVVFEISE